MSLLSYTVVSGRVVLVAKSPDGDSVRFVPDHPALLRRLANGEHVKISADGSVQLRFDGIDAPELHYEGDGQPRGGAARNALLAHLGFRDVVLAPDGTTVAGANPESVRIVVLARIVEVNGRPVAVVFDPDEVASLGEVEGMELELTPELLRRSVNVWEAEEGVVYPLVYTSTAPELRAVFVGAARGARTAGRGVWSADSSTTFPVTDARALGPAGALIWPKLFRRATDHLQRRSPGQTLPAWLAANPQEDDDVLVLSTGGDDADAEPVALHTLLSQAGEQVTLGADLLDLVVVEREPSTAVSLDDARWDGPEHFGIESHDADRCSPAVNTVLTMAADLDPEQVVREVSETLKKKFPAVDPIEVTRIVRTQVDELSGLPVQDSVSVLAQQAAKHQLKGS